nr:endoribonuclease Dicer homolog 2-like [Tanacetum cinerariifolium]
MTASPVKAKGSSSNEEYWKQIKTLESVMHSKVYTCVSESVLAEYISFSTPKYRYYKDTEVPRPALEMIKRDLSRLRERHESKIRNSNLSESSMEKADSSVANDFFTWGKQDARGETVAREFCKDANDIFSSYIPAGWLTNHINQRSVDLGLLSAKVNTRQVNIIVATSILEEGLDSRGRARMRNSEFLLLIRSGDVETQDKVNNYLISGQIMRDESLSHAAEPCEPPNSAIFNQPVYRVESTGASLSLSSSISMVYFYRSRLPSDGFVLNYLAFNAIMYTLVCNDYSIGWVKS